MNMEFQSGLVYMSSGRCWRMVVSTRPYESFQVCWNQSITLKPQEAFRRASMCYFAGMHSSISTFCHGHSTEASCWLDGTLVDR